MIDAIIGAAVEVASDITDRDLHVARPSRSVSAVRRAATPPTGWSAFASCVEHRESHGNPRAVNPSGAAGLFQFMPNWRHGAPYIVRERLMQFGTSGTQARSVRLYLSRLGRIEKYPALYQRIAFAEVIEDGGRSAALRHWGLAGSRCQALVP